MYKNAKPIENYPNYAVYKSGRVKNSKTGRFLNLRRKKSGYYDVCLCRGGKKSTFSIHRLVAIAFKPNPENKPDVNHKDGNKKNNKAENLDWMTRAENIQHAWDNGLIKRKSLHLKH